MPWEGDLGLNVGASILYDAFRFVFGKVREGRDRVDLRRELGAALAGYDRRLLCLDAAELDRLVDWVFTWDERLLGGDGEGRAALVAALANEVFRLHDPLAVTGDDLEGWKVATLQRADRLAGALRGALFAVLPATDRPSLFAAVAAGRSAETARSVWAQLGWLREGLEGLGERLDPGLPLERARLAPPSWGQPLSPYELLWPRFGIVPYDDRAGWLGELAEWCRDAAEPISVQVVAGAGGMGKTRLALQLCSQMAGEGWTVGLYRRDADLRSLEALASLAAPRLVVFDYADETPTLVVEVLSKLVERRPLAVHRLRVVLLVRRVPEHGDPRRLFHDGQTMITRLVNRHPALLISDALDGTTRVDFDLAARNGLYRSARDAFSRYLSAESSGGEVDLSSATFGSPLFVLMAAALGRDLVGVTPDEVLDQVLDREQSRWVQDTDPCPEKDQDLQRAAVAVATLFGADSPADMDAVLMSMAVFASDGSKPNASASACGFIGCAGVTAG